MSSKAAPLPGVRQRHGASTDNNSSSSTAPSTAADPKGAPSRPRGSNTAPTDSNKFSWMTGLLYVVLTLLISGAVGYVGLSSVQDAALYFSNGRTTNPFEAVIWYTADRSDGLLLAYPVPAYEVAREESVQAHNARLFARVTRSGAFTQLQWPSRDIYVRVLPRRVRLNATSGVPESTVLEQQALFTALAAAHREERAASEGASGEPASLLTWGMAEIDPFTSQVVTDDAHLAPIRCMREDATVQLHVKGTTSAGMTDFLNTYKTGRLRTFTMEAADRCLGFALSLMCEGDKWEVVCGPQSAQGTVGQPNSNILPNQALVYVIDLREVRPPAYALERDAATLEWPIRTATRRLAYFRGRALLPSLQATAAEKEKAEEALRSFSRADLLETAKAHVYESLWDSVE